jgi:hypothetical protein
MSHWHTRTEHWLSTEHGEQDASVDDSFADVLAALPTIEPSEDFVRRSVRAAWSVRARRQRTRVYAAIAACVLVAVSFGAAVYVLAGEATGWAVAALASVASGSTASLTMATVASIEWWATMARVGDVVLGVISVPQNAVGLLVIELVGGGALYALHRLLRADAGFRSPGTLCV